MDESEIRKSKQHLEIVRLLEPREALARIKSWGPRIEVTGPMEVRNRWLEDARELIRRYDT
jgi:predicted DNA-binding transcriptional regulator YafY